MAPRPLTACLAAGCRQASDAAGEEDAEGRGRTGYWGTGNKGVGRAGIAPGIGFDPSFYLDGEGEGASGGHHVEDCDAVARGDRRTGGFGVTSQGADVAGGEFKQEDDSTTPHSNRETTGPESGSRGEGEGDEERDAVLALDRRGNRTSSLSVDREG